MKITQRILLSAGTAVFLSFGGMAWSAPPGGHGLWGGPAIFSSPEALSSLGITDDQKASLKAISEKHKAAAVPLWKEFASERREMRKLIYANPPNDDAIRELSARMAQTGAELAVQRAHFHNDLRSVFTSEQIREVEEALSKADPRTDRVLEHIARSIGRE
jgi:Spy/CpxP family protein refolding chaperone